jgi:hypothetical protein
MKPGRALALVLLTGSTLAAGCGNDQPNEPSETTTTTSISTGAPSAQRYTGTLVVPPPQGPGNLPLDLSLFFGLPRAASSDGSRPRFMT